MNLWLVCWWLTLHGSGASLVTVACGCGCDGVIGYALVHRGVVVGMA